MYSVYNIETGKIRAQFNGESLAVANIHDGEAYTDVFCDFNSHIIVDGEAVDAPPIPVDPQAVARRMRKYLLDSSDWTQVSDNQLTEEEKANWASYRQALRDFPQTVVDAGVSTETEIENLLPQMPKTL